jgi:HSP20 family protein
VNTFAYSNGRRFGTLLGWDPMLWSAVSSPVTVEHSDDSVTITIDMPGVDANDLDLTFTAGTLSITGKRGDQSYQYSVTLGDMIDPDQIEGHLDKGVLTVHAHKRPEAKPRKIAIATAPQKMLDTGEQ